MERPEMTYQVCSKDRVGITIESYLDTLDEKEQMLIIITKVGQDLFKVDYKFKK